MGGDHGDIASVNGRANNGSIVLGDVPVSPDRHPLRRRPFSLASDLGDGDSDRDSDGDRDLPLIAELEDGSVILTICRSSPMASRRVGSVAGC